ncbi:hypothetical protein [Roseivivax sp. THAF197b]|uniref:hypothetical protein n=1 Tax=Roseivivax sp. THAF197b TaxID=2588299 RepID=UPI0012686F38|nr:hypothetical protein [Roseivivax sp. THAF197b]QFS84827.1 hypothetical protein FIV09_18450 [Roseivivax sp. THAF197b]
MAQIVTIFYRALKAFIFVYGLVGISDVDRSHYQIFILTSFIVSITSGFLLSYQITKALWRSTYFRYVILFDIFLSVFIGIFLYIATNSPLAMVFAASVFSNAEASAINASYVRPHYKALLLTLLIFNCVLALTGALHLISFLIADIIIKATMLLLLGISIGYGEPGIKGLMRDHASLYRKNALTFPINSAVGFSKFRIFELIAFSVAQEIGAISTRLLEFLYGVFSLLVSRKINSEDSIQNYFHYIGFALHFTQFTIATFVFLAILSIFSRLVGGFEDTNGTVYDLGGAALICLPAFFIYPITIFLYKIFSGNKLFHFSLLTHAIEVVTTLSLMLISYLFSGSFIFLLLALSALTISRFALKTMFLKLKLADPSYIFQNLIKS